MRRKEIIKKLNHLENIFQNLELIVIDLRNEIRHNRKSIVSTKKKLSAYTKIRDLLKLPDWFSDFSGVINCEPIKSEEYWIDFFTDNHNDSKFIVKLHNDILQIIKSRKALKKLLSQSLIDESINEKMIETNGRKDFIIKTFILPDKDDLQTKPSRISQAFDGIYSIYRAIAKILNENENSVYVLRLDSGSDKGFDLLGIQKILVWVEKTVKNIWEKVAFYKQEKQEKDINNVLHGLDIFTKINELKKDGALTPEEAEIIKRDSLSGIRKIINSGTITEEMNYQPEQKMLASKEIKLIGSGLSSIDKNLEDNKKSL